jgi:hypothetical protein
MMRVRALLTACCAGSLLAAGLPTFTSHTESHTERISCQAPVIDIAPQTSGEVRFRIRSPCRKGELVMARYDEVVIMERLDQSGNLTFHLDCFLGDHEVALIFADDWRTTSRACPVPENALTKIAIVWQDRVDLDLHAFEYAALPGSDYDRWSGNPGSYAEAETDSRQSGRSRGFISTASDGRQLGHNVEVYTLLRHPAESRGLIAMAVALGAQAAAAESCDSGRRDPLRVDLDVYVLEHGSRLRSYQRTFSGQPCAGAPTRSVTNLVPNIVLGGAAGEVHDP